jgi:UDP-N-acetylmuramoyl-tripeptide--D-alanyl-D-alanine ligase
LHTPAGSAEILLPLPGRHNVLNALAASALALAAGAPFAAIVKGLRHAEPVQGRQIAHRLANGAVLIDDSYNANPGSVTAAIATLVLASGASWLVLGDMKELGEGAAQLHAEMGLRAKQAGLDRLWTIGELSREASDSFGTGARHFLDQETLIAALRSELHAGVRCLIKGSRSSAMDRVVAALLATTVWTKNGEETGHAA